jgi:diguanylate cyclase (GGDEF)-like protein
LTGLYTKNSLLRVLHARFTNGKAPLPTALLYIEFDDLNRFNDMFGYEIDDHILRKLTQCVVTYLNDEIFARVGTYRFAIATPYDAEEQLRGLAEMIISALHEPFNVDGTMFYVTATIGIARLSESIVNAQMLFKHAESTMQHLQREGTNHIGFYIPADETYLKTELQLMKDLPGAIDRGELRVVYQPQYSLKERSYVGAEALVRWKHPELGDISPAVFIPLAEKSGMIVPLTVNILIEVSRMFETLVSIGKKEFSLSVNMPASVLMEQSFLGTMQFLQELYGLSGKALFIEIMEDTIPENMDTFIHLLNQIKQMGIGIAIDDFGTGHTSLHYLVNFPADTLKIDRSFVRGIHHSEKIRLLFRAICDMASALEMKIVAEGVEEKEETEALSAFGNIVVQGYYYSDPLCAERLLELLEREAQEETF